MARLTDKELLVAAGQATGDERGATVRLVATLVEVDKRQLYRDAGCSSLFTFCTQVLRLSESEAYLRMEAARAARRFPLILQRLADASLTLTSVSLLAKHLTEDNHVALLDEARHRSKREVEAIVARINPRPDAVSIVRKLPGACGVLAGRTVACVGNRAAESVALDAPASIFALESGHDAAGVRQAHEGKGPLVASLASCREDERVFEQHRCPAPEGSSRAAPGSHHRAGEDAARSHLAASPAAALRRGGDGEGTKSEDGRA